MSVVLFFFFLTWALQLMLNIRGLSSRVLWLQSLKSDMRHPEEDHFEPGPEESASIFGDTEVVASNSHVYSSVSLCCLGLLP